MKKSLFRHLLSPHVFCLIVFLSSCLLFSTWLMTHTFSYDVKSESMTIAAKCWSDFGSHIPLIRSFSLGANFDRMRAFHMPEYPIFPGVPIRYHFLFYMLVGLLEKIGLRIDWALNIPSILGFFSLLLLIYFLTIQQFNNRAISLLSLLFFLFNGSLSFLTFFKKHPLSIHTIQDIVTNTAFSSFGPWDNGLISAFWTLNIYTNQRHLAAGFAMGLLFLALCICIENKSWKKQLPFLFLSVPMLVILPFFHQPMLIILGIFALWYIFAFPKLRIFLVLTGLLSAGPILLQIFTFSNSASLFAYHPGYLINGSLTAAKLFSYWFYNLGLHLFLIPIGFLMAPRYVKKVLFPIFPLFLIANLFKFSVEIAANHKFFNFFMIFGNMLSAYVIIELWNKTKKAWGDKIFADRFPSLTSQSNALRRDEKTASDVVYGKSIASSGAKKFCYPARHITIFFLPIRLLFSLSLACLVLLLTLSGIIDFFPILNDSKIPVVDPSKQAISQWIQANTPKDAVFLNTSYLYNPASLAGRSIFLGWPYFPWSAGYKENRMPMMKKIYESKDPRIFCPLLKHYTISYIEVQSVTGDPDLPTIDPSYFHSLAQPVFTTANDAHAFFTTKDLCKIP